MLKNINYILLCLATTLLLGCNDDGKYDYVIQMENGHHIKVDHPIYYLGIHVGNIKEINFGNVNQKDYVFASIQLKEKNILQKESEFFFNSNGFLEFRNQQTSVFLEEKDTIFMTLQNEVKVINKNPIIKPLETETLFDSKEKENLSVEEIKKLDSLENKIKILNQLIQEINDEN